MNNSPENCASELNGKPISFLQFPRVNVVVTCFNYDHFILQALNSVAQQTYTEFSCVIVDDASTDDSGETINRWIASRGDPRFRLIKNQRNLGQMGSFAVALAATEGEFVAFLDADDIWFPNFLGRHVEVQLNQLQPAGASCSDLVQIDAEGRVLAGSVMATASESGGVKLKKFIVSDADLLSGADVSLIKSEPKEVRYIAADWGAWHWSVTSGMLFRRSLVELFVPANTERLRLGADIYLMVLSHGFAGSFVIRDKLGAYRRHGNNSFASLPVFGTPSVAPLATTVENLGNAYGAILDHMLDASERISAAFSPGAFRKQLRSLFRLFLRQGKVPHDPRIAAMVGHRRVFTDRMQAKIGFLRRKLV
jgi:glycosyltransferase involved in cell wall biosynthesis